MENLLLVIFVSVMAGQLVRGSDPQPPGCPLGKTFKAPVINDCTSYWNCVQGEVTKKKCPRSWLTGQKKFDYVELECITDLPLHRARCYKAPPTPKPPTDPPKTPSPPTKPSSNSSPPSTSTSPTSPPSTTPSSSTPPSSTPPTAGPTKPGGASSIAPFGWLLMAILVAAPAIVTR